MTEYQLPMKDDKVDWDVMGGLAENGLLDEHIDSVLKAIDAHARADERKRCENVCWAEHKRSGDGTDGAYRLHRAILAIRSMGGE